jgi:LysR family carnitine catabolism transcriptional activator
MNVSQRQLRMFVTTAATLNVSRAAQALHITQPALTRALQDFEAQLGVKLFHRTTRRTTLSADGARLLPTAQRLLHDLQALAEEARARAGGLAGHLVVAVGTAFGSGVLPEAVRAFALTHPGVRLRVVDDNAEGITRRVAQAEADLGIGSPVGPDAGLLATRRLAAYPLGVLLNEQVFRARQPMDRRALQSLPLLKESEDSSVLQLLRREAPALAEQMHDGMEVTSLSLQIAFVRAGVGVAVVSALAARHPAAQGLRFVPLVPSIERELSVMWRPDRPPGAAAQALLASLDSVLATRR